MGFMSRRILPVCANFCIFCPSFRARSRQPVKRYKKLISDVFQEGNARERMIAKLCDYASKNTLRIPKITASLEQRGYKGLHNGQFGCIKIMVDVYIKLFSACKDQMSLFAMSAIDMIRVLLEQNRHDDICVLGCNMLIEFTSNQVDGTYLYQLDALVLSLCSLARETMGITLQSSCLRALSGLIWLMGEHLRMPSEYDCVVSVIMEHYGHWSVTVNDQASAIQMPSLWAQLCIEKIAQFCREVTTTRRFLEPMFRFFDSGEHWSPNGGLAVTVLQQILHFIENFGNDCFLVVVLVRHLDHCCDPQIRADIVRIGTCLVRQSKSRATSVEVSVLNDMLRHLRTTLQVSATEAPPWNEEQGGYKDLHLALQDFLSELLTKVGDSLPIFELMALNLETLPSVPASSRQTIRSLLILARIMASQPALIKMQQCFPETLLHQLALAMVHPDSATRIGAHHIFETVLISLSPSNDERQKSFVLTTPPNSAERNSSQSGLNKETEKQLGCTSPSGNHNTEGASRLSKDQAALLLSSLWNEAKLENNSPDNYKANYSTYTLMLRFSPAKTSKDLFLWSFQLPLSLKTLASQMNDNAAPIAPSYFARQRSFLTLATSMIVFASEIYGIPGMRDQMKFCSLRDTSVMMEEVDSHLHLGDLGIKSTDIEKASHDVITSDSLASFEPEGIMSTESLVSLILSGSSTPPEELANLRNALLQTFSTVHGCLAYGSSTLSSTARPWTAVLHHDSNSFDEVLEPKEDFIPSTNVPGVSQLVESAIQRAGQVAAFALPTSPLPFSAVATRCEAFGTLAKRKIPLWTNVSLPSSCHMQLARENLTDCGGKDNSNSFVELPVMSGKEPRKILELPPISHYDTFLRAAGC